MAQNQSGSEKAGAQRDPMASSEQSQGGPDKSQRQKAKQPSQISGSQGQRNEQSRHQDESAHTNQRQDGPGGREQG